MAKKKQEKVEPPKGRPKFEPDYTVVESCLGLQLNQEEIAHVLGCDADTLSAAVKRDHGKTWKEFISGKMGNVKYTIRRKLYQEALAGNTRALLKMDDKLFPPESRLAGPNGGPIPTASATKGDIDWKEVSTETLLELQKAFKVAEQDEDDDE